MSVYTKYIYNIYTIHNFYFRRLCILKGVFPREPRNRKKVQKGNSRIQTLYYEKVRTSAFRVSGAWEEFIPQQCVIVSPRR